MCVLLMPITISNDSSSVLSIEVNTFEWLIYELKFISIKRFDFCGRYFVSQFARRTFTDSFPTISKKIGANSY